MVSRDTFLPPVSYKHYTTSKPAKTPPARLRVGSGGKTQLASSRPGFDSTVSGIRLNQALKTQLELFATALPQGVSSYHPLIPIFYLSRPVRVYYPVHKTYILQNPEERFSSSLVPQLLDTSLVQYIVDVKPDAIRAAPPNNPAGDPKSQKILISSQLALSVLESLGKPGVNTEELKKAWRDSRIEDLRDLIMRENELEKNQYPLTAYVSDAIASILAVQLPDQPPSLSELSLPNGIGEAIEELMAASANEMGRLELAWLRSRIPLDPIMGPYNLAARMLKVEGDCLEATATRATNLFGKLKDLRIKSLSEEHLSEAESFEPTYILPAVPPQAMSTEFTKIDSTGVYGMLKTNIPGKPDQAGETRKVTTGRLRIEGMPQTSANGDAMPDFVNMMKSDLRRVGERVVADVADARKEFITSSLLTTAGVGMVIYSGFDAMVAASLWAITTGMLYRKFWIQMEDGWKLFYAAMVTSSSYKLGEMKQWMLDYARRANVNKPGEIIQKKEELEELKRDLATARQLVVEMVPELEKRYPDWTGREAEKQETTA
ncbi:hypothetical protein ABW19_dt0202457 [Dactylella cylindrospora]|nr:hypothetical protein ABW19_dt0202457 [Dactylella cylindrospora]